MVLVKLDACMRENANRFISITVDKTQVQVEEVNIKPDMLNLIEEKLGNSLEQIDSGDNFLNRTTMA